MRIHVFSDLHLEFAPLDLPEEVKQGKLAELVLLAGDIHVKRRSVKWAARTFKQQIAMVGGNHESYGDSLYAMISDSRAQAAAESDVGPARLRYLEREAWHLKARDGAPIRILGATLWTNFELFGPATRLEAMRHAIVNLNDYHSVKIREAPSVDDRRLDPKDTSYFHHLAIEFLTTELRQKFDGLTVVMTHHAPSAQSLPQAGREDLLSACYASSLDPFIEEHQPDLWVHGHIHASNDYRIGQTRIVSNPRGYPYGVNRQ